MNNRAKEKSNNLIKKLTKNNWYSLCFVYWCCTLSCWISGSKQRKWMQSSNYSLLPHFLLCLLTPCPLSWSNQFRYYRELDLLENPPAAATHTAICTKDATVPPGLLASHKTSSVSWLFLVLITVSWLWDSDSSKESDHGML